MIPLVSERRPGRGLQAGDPEPGDLLAHVMGHPLDAAHRLDRRSGALDVISYDIPIRRARKPRSAGKRQNQAALQFPDVFFCAEKPLAPNSSITYAGVNVPALTIASITQPPERQVLGAAAAVVLLQLFCAAWLLRTLVV